MSYYSHEQDLVDTFARQITPFWQSQVVQGHFSGVAGFDIAYAYVIHPEPVDSIVISAGRVESLVKYQEVVFELYQNGYSVFIHDHRGQGLSARLHDDGHRGFVDDFDHYVTDMETFFEQWVAPNTNTTPLLLCHSMGCTIGGLYLIKNPRHFRRVVFSAPMFGIKTPLPDWLAVNLVRTGRRLNNLLSEKPWYFISQAPYIDVPFALNPLTHSKVRYKLFRQQYQLNSDLQLGGVTYHWLHEALRAMQQFEQQAEQLQLPVLLIQAGGDHVVENIAQDRIVSKIAQCDKRVIRDAKHELLMEQDAYRKPVMDAIYSFFQHV